MFARKTVTSLHTDYRCSVKYKGLHLTLVYVKDHFVKFNKGNVRLDANWFFKKWRCHELTLNETIQVDEHFICMRHNQAGSLFILSDHEFMHPDSGSVMSTVTVRRGLIPPPGCFLSLYNNTRKSLLRLCYSNINTPLNMEQTIEAH